MRLKLLNVHAIGLERHFEDTRPDASQCVDHAIVGGALDDHRRSVRNEQPDDKLDRLLRPRGHDHIFRCCQYPLLGNVFDNRTAEADASVGGVVDEIWRQTVGYDRVQAILEFLRAFGIRLGIIGHERDNMRMDGAARASTGMRQKRHG